MENSNTQAYPSFGMYGESGPKRSGLTKREHFAGLAMQGMCSNINHMDAGYDVKSIAEYLSHHAVQMADALLKELEKPTKP